MSINVESNMIDGPPNIETFSSGEEVGKSPGNLSGNLLKALGYPESPICEIRAKMPGLFRRKCGRNPDVRRREVSALADAHGPEPVSWAVQPL